MLHPLVVKIQRKEVTGSSSMPVWTGFSLHVGALLASGWMAIGMLSHGAWVPGIVVGIAFVTALFMTTGYLFPDNRRR